MYLFEMSESELDRRVNAYYNNLYEQFWEGSEEAECSNCSYYQDGLCEKLGNKLTADEWDDMAEANDYSSIEKDPDDCCDEHEFKECD